MNEEVKTAAQPEAANAGGSAGSAGASKLPPWAKTTLRVLRILLVPILCFMALIGGLIVGYVYIGGQDLSDVWKISTWKHVFDLMFAES